MNFHFLGIVGCVLFGHLGRAEQSPLVIFSDEPAAVWDQGYGNGNGRLGALSFGVYPKEIITLNEGSVFDKSKLQPPTNSADSVADARALCDQGKYKEADDVFRSKILLSATLSGSYSQAGLLNVEFLNAPEKTSYRRSLDMQTGRVETAVETKGGIIKTELVCSSISDCVAYRISNTLRGGLDVSLKLKHKTSEIEKLGQNVLVLKGQADNGGTTYETRLVIKADGAKIESGADGEVILKSSREIVVYASIRTDYNKKNTLEPLKDDLSASNERILAFSSSKGWAQIKEESATYFASLMKRCSVDVGDSPEEVRNMSTKTRIERIKKGEKDPDLVEQLFQFGRYCMIANCHPDSLPVGLQGLWNPELKAPWSGCYFLNINCEMNYWPAEVTGLGEYHRAFTNFIISLQPSGERFSKIIGYEGFCFGHNVDCWKNTYFSGDNPEWAASLMNGAWACSHLVEYYRFNGDKEYLRKCLPILESNARFVLSWFRPDSTTGEYLSGPGVSPETGFYVTNDDGQKVLCYVSNGNSHDLLLGREALRNYIYICAQLGVNPPLLSKAKQVLTKIPLPGIGDDGRLMEWRKQFEEMQKGHRHVSHCYGLFPGNEFDVLNTPKYAQAVKKSLDFRLKNGGGHTGWSEAWLINLYATLGDGDKAYELMNRMLKNRINPNLFDMHPPFQIDGNFGMTAGLAQCLIQSQIEQDGMRVIQIGPALASAWVKGSAEGLRARGGLMVNISWDNKKITAKIKAERSGKFRLMHGKDQKDVLLKAGQEMIVDFKREMAD